MLAMTQLVGFGSGSAGGNDQFTTMLLHFDGADASTTFTDSSLSAHTVTAAGNAQIDNAQSEFGGTSGLFDGTGDYLTLDGSSDFAFGSGDFTIDFWVRFNSVSGVPIIYDSRPISTSGFYPTIYLSGGVLVFFTNTATRITTTTTIVTNTWYHVALARSGTSTKMFINGTQEGSTYSDSNTYVNGTSRPTIASQGFSITNYFNGWLDEFRVSKGIARWTANFTPPVEQYQV